MIDPSAVLRALMRIAPEYCSREQLATELNVSPAIIVDTIQSLQASGYHIEERHDRSYRYVANNQLSAPVIESGLTTAIPFELRILPTVDSTNAYLKRQVMQSPLTKPLVVVADTQTAGYGRSGRAFYSPEQTGIYLSIGLPIADQQSFDAGLLTTSTAVVVAETLQQLFAVPVALKWVNDVLVNQHKVVGILAEGVTAPETSQLTAVVIGIGINLTTKAFPADLASKAGAVVTKQVAVTRNQVIQELLRRFFERYPTYRTGDFMPVYRQLSMVIGQQVALKAGDQTYRGQVVDIDQTGALVVRLANGSLQRFTSGEITKVNLATGAYRG
ncbi:biotin--[acetyl-CoA-carboxylase] ligase [Lactiplantibacillus herbarum]|uniref:biotin--[acetyl-CoA-carboxylase] ligase n=1 Tax=Lactiplantibacillus herbarum TaxID=1670446 RepID=UPI00064E36AA|nr:biotin--[acetyl-CoA-carboxylase] ligase [Lactiplantibacillus herbarum]